MKFIIIMLALVTQVFADELKIKINPEKPLYNEPFNIEFIIKTDEGSDPVINFDPLGLEIISRSEVSTSTRLTYINGNSSIEKTISLSYEAIAPRSGAAFLRNIKVELNGKLLKHKTLRIQILKKAIKDKNIFVRAEVDKTRVFVGESIIVRYFLYNRVEVPLVSTDIKKFPKLDKFLKRFHQEKLSRQRVRVNGQMYDRRIMYTAQLYAEKAGTFKVDPIMMKIGYSKRGNSFGNFGFNLQLGRSKSTTILSKNVEIEVLSLPANGMEPHFSGLVGKHKFKLKTNKNKFIANEPIEIQLLVEGNGAMELFEAPSLITDGNVEEFEKSSDLIINSDFTATKKIEYTYLGRGDVNIDNLVIPISYFDPATQTYITEKLEVGSIKVAGLGEIQKVDKIQNNNKKELVPKPMAVEKVSWEFKPFLKPINTFLYGVKEVFIVLCLLLAFMLGFIIYKFIRAHKPVELTAFEEIYRNGLDYANMHKVLSTAELELGMTETVKSLKIKEETKEYLFSLIDKLNENYSSGKNDEVIKIKRKAFQELEKALLPDEDE